MQRRINWLILTACLFVSVQNIAYSEQADFSTHHSDHDEDAQVDTLPMVHVHGLRLNKDQQFGPVPQKTPWPTIPRELEGKELDDWLKASFLVGKDGEATVVILQPAAHRELTQVSLQPSRNGRFCRNWMETTLWKVRSPSVSISALNKFPPLLSQWRGVEKRDN